MARASAKKTVRRVGRPSKAEVAARTAGNLALAMIASGEKLVPVLVPRDVAELLQGLPSETIRRLILDVARRGLAKL